MTGLTLQHFLIIGAVLFIIGMVGFLTRRNLIILFLCAEMMLQGVAINLCAFARYRGNLQGQAFVLFILTVAACSGCRDVEHRPVSSWVGGPQKLLRPSLGICS